MPERSQVDEVPRKVSGAWDLHLTALDRMIRFDGGGGLIEIEAGAMWPQIIAATHAAQPEHIRWGIRQKQRAG